MIFLFVIYAGDLFVLYAKGDSTESRWAFPVRLQLECKHERPPCYLFVFARRVCTLFPWHGHARSDFHVAGRAGRNGVLGTSIEEEDPQNGSLILLHALARRVLACCLF